jgi:twitching motility two-component system response regulator PilG
MVVDDSPTIRKLVGLTMTKNGFKVVEAGDGEEALEQIRIEGVPDVVLVDVVMPGMDGLTLCKRIRQDPVTARVPVIILSAHDGFLDKVRGKMAGSDRYLTKPFEPAALVRAVREFCPQGAR